MMVLPLTRMLLVISCCALANASDVLMSDRTTQDVDTFSDFTPAGLPEAVHDIRIGAGILQAPYVSETVNHPSGTSDDIDWKGATRYGYSVSVSYVGTAMRGSKAAGDLLWGSEFSYQSFDSTPNQYYINGASSPVQQNNNQSIALQYQSARVGLMLGWGSRPLATELGAVHVEALVAGSAGIAWADTQGHDIFGNPERKRGAGLAYAFGPRVGAYLCDSGYVFGLHLEYQISRSHVRIALPNGDDSDLHIKGHGFGGEVELGYRF